MIKGRCRTNIDKFHREEWPNMFNDNIAVGHSVQSKSGVVLKVVNITHKMVRIHHDKWDEEPTIVVELHTIDGRIPQ